jgi:hypothetical protein
MPRSTAVGNVTAVALENRESYRIFAEHRRRSLISAPSKLPILCAASRSSISTSPGGYDVSRLFHCPKLLDTWSYRWLTGRRTFPLDIAMFGPTASPHRVGCPAAWSLNIDTPEVFCSHPAGKDDLPTDHTSKETRRKTIQPSASCGRDS